MTEREQHLLRLVAEAIVRPSFERCCEHGHAFFDTFYAGLADRVPGVGAMFAHTDMQKQNALIREGISALIDHAAGNAAAGVELQRLGHLHGRDQLNIQPAMYGGWVDALMQTVAADDPERTDEVEAAWREVVAPGIELMTSLY